VVRVLSEAREWAAVPETAQVELGFPGPREARSSGARKRVLRRVVVKFVPRVRATRRNGRSSLVVEMSPAGAGDAQKLRLRIDVAPMRGRHDPALISMGVAAFRVAPGAQDADAEELLTRTPVSVRFDLNMGNLGDTEAGDEGATRALSSIQSLGPMLAELQLVRFQERARSTKPRNVEFTGAADRSEYWVRAAADESWLGWPPDSRNALENAALANKPGFEGGLGVDAPKHRRSTRRSFESRIKG
jgi:hypothetical protein